MGYSIITADRYLLADRRPKGIYLILQLDQGRLLQCPAVWSRKREAFVSIARNGNKGETLAMYDASRIGPQLRRAGIAFTAIIKP